MTARRAVAVAATVAAVVAAMFVASACGTLDRDVIVENDMDAGVHFEEAGRVEPAVIDAAPPPAPSATGPACEREDGGCPTPVHCELHECSLVCPFGCTGTINGGTSGDHARSHKRPPPYEVSP